MILAATLTIFGGILSGPVAFFAFNSFIIWLICSKVAAGMSNVFLIVFLLLIFKILGCVWDFRIIDCAVAMLLVLFPGLPSISSGEPEVFSTMLADSELNKLKSLDLSVTIFPFFSIAMVSFVRKPF